MLTKSTTFIAAALAVTLLAAGCQEQVVSETFRPMTGLPGDYSHAGAPRAAVQQPPKKNKNVIEKTWDGIDSALFGWMKDDKPQPSPTTRPAVRRYDPIWVRPEEQR